MKTSSAKAKGRDLQKWVVAQLLQNEATLEADDVKSTSMGAPGEDVQLSPAARRRYPFQFECKNYAKIAVYGFYEQAAKQGKHEPVVVIKQNRSKPLLIIDAEYFFRSYKCI